MFFEYNVLWNYSPYVFTSDFISLRFYSLFFTLGLFFVYFKVKKDLSNHIDDATIEEIIFPSIIFMLIFSRVFHCIFYEFSYYSNNIIEILLPIRLNPFEFAGYQGLSSHGGFVGFLVSYFVLSNKKIKFDDSLRFLDTIFYYSLVFISLIRIGNLFNSEILGKACNQGLCLTFTLYDSIPRYPVQLYESISYLSLFILLVFAKDRIQRIPGRLLLIVVSMVAFLRFFLEFLKDTQSDIVLSYLNMGQILTIPILTISLFFLYMLNNKKIRNLS